MSRDESAPRVIAPERAGKVGQAPDWRAIAGRLAGALRGTAARTEAVKAALDEYDRATEGK